MISTLLLYLLSILFLGCDMVKEQVAGSYGEAKDANDHTEVIFEVPKGTNARSLGPLLEKAGLVESGEDFTFYVKLSKEGSCIKAGKFSLKPSMSASELIETMCGKALTEDVPFTVKEGERIRDIDAALTKAGLIKAGEYKQLAAQPSKFKADFPLPKSSLEGYLYPETYMITPGKFTAKAFIQRQLDTFNEKYYQRQKDNIEKSPRTLNELVIVASLLEREEPTAENRPLVSGIIWKRLDKPMYLGIDATSHYNLPNWNDREGLLRNLKDESDPYNTRKKLGLPPTAIGNPNVDSLDAALNPKASKYWYYLHDKNGVIRPATNNAGHERNRKKYNVY